MKSEKDPVRKSEKRQDKLPRERKKRFNHCRCRIFVFFLGGDHLLREPSLAFWRVARSGKFREGFAPGDSFVDRPTERYHSRPKSRVHDRRLSSRRLPAGVSGVYTVRPSVNGWKP